MSSAVLRVAEVFGPTFQGEGVSAGQRAAFIRLSGCPVGCVWCDEPQTWDWSRYDKAAESRPMTAEVLSSWALSVPSELVVITGGEPLVQQRGLVELGSSLADAGRAVEIETSGTIAPLAALTAVISRFHVSPKLAHAGVAAERRIRPKALSAFLATGKADFKFVVQNRADLDEVAALQATLGLEPVWIMPEGVTPERVLDRMRHLADDVLARGWHLTPRLQILLWGDARAR